jgi:hypothetical protein
MFLPLPLRRVPAIGLARPQRFVSYKEFPLINSAHRTRLRTHVYLQCLLQALKVPSNLRWHCLIKQHVADGRTTQDSKFAVSLKHTLLM